MVKRGWEYTPIKIDIPTDASMLSPTADSNRLFDAEFRTAFGYGVATAYSDDGRIKEGAPTPNGVATSWTCSGPTRAAG